jgi:ABC-2 type transport system ATP-binding protein
MEENMEAVNYAIEVKNVGLKIKKDVILKEINVNFEKGKIHGIVGRNGCGKTMLMKCICGFVRYTKGEIFVEGQKIGKDIDFPRNIGIIIETPGFIPYYSGYKNLKLLAGLKNKIGKKEIEETLELVGLDPKLKKSVRKYSLGMRQRLGMAQAIMENPDIFILDEPMNGLDNEGVEEMRVILKGLKEEGKTILLVSHNSEDISILSDEIYYMDKGTMEKGKKSQV